MQQLILNTNNVVELQNLKNSVTGDAVIDAVVECTIYKRDGVPMTGQIWPLSMQHVSDGLYRGTLDWDLMIRSGKWVPLDSVMRIRTTRPS